MPPDFPSAPVTLKDIAQAAGVHISTVSLALRSSPKIAQATRDRIHQAAEKLGYQRDPIYFALSARRGLAPSARPLPRILFVTNRESIADFEKGVHMREFLAGAQAQAQATGFACELCLIDNKDVTPENLETVLAQHEAQALILAAIMPPVADLRVDWSRYAVVKIDSYFISPAVARISHDQQQIVRTACERLHALGYKRIGMAVGDFDEKGSDDLFSTGYWVSQYLLGLPAINPLYFERHESYESCTRRLKQWTLDNKLDAVISNFGTVRGFLEAGGIKVPDEVGCACLCLDESKPDLAGTVMNHFTVGRKAVEMIALLIKTRQLGVPRTAPTLYVEGDWSDGSSAPLRSS